MSPVETYLSELYAIHCSGAGTKETSYYPVLSKLLNEVGRSLKPKVHCIINLRNQGAGLPDGGLFTQEQTRKTPEDKYFDQIPARGAIEVKGAERDIKGIIASQQVRDYVARYRQVLVTNLREFALVRQEFGEPVTLECYSLSATEADFWAIAAHGRTASKDQGERLVEYLKRVMLYTTTIAEPKDLAGILASYARDARARVEAADLPALNAVRTALEEALGLKFEGEKGEHFFRSTLVQTIFYGVFSAWVLWDRETPRTDKSARFDWRLAQWKLHVPMIRALYAQIADPHTLGSLNMVEVLDWAGDALNRVDRNEFFGKFEEGHAVQYFYEPFLEAFDPELRKELGVWYTPPEIVQYMVARVDTVLREELGIADGLADPNVYVLDPCCGTGAYLVEVLKRIQRTLKEKGSGGLLGQDVKLAATSRVFGFEILPAPFVIGHLQLGLLLQNLGAPLSDEKDERACIYLTNALTGWEPPTGPKQHLIFPEMELERDAAERIKRDVPILVILGNPPYNGFAGVSPAEEQGLLEPYKEGLSEWGITKNYLDDLYVRFFRLAERRIAEGEGRGVVCFISNHSWVSEPTFVVLRKHLLESFDRFWVEDMHGNRRISEYAPDGRTSETIFALAGFSPGIQQATAISLWVKGTRAPGNVKVRFRGDLDAAKASERREQLLGSLKTADFDAQYDISGPCIRNRFDFRPVVTHANYYGWPALPDLASVKPLLGLNDNRGQATHDPTQSTIRQRMQAYYSAAVPFDELAALHPGLTSDAAGFDARAARRRLLRESHFDESNIKAFLFKPMDRRWAYVERVGNLWNRVRPELLEQAWEGNSFLLARCHAPKFPDGASVFFARDIADQHVMHTDAYFFPVFLRVSPKAAQGCAEQVALPDLDLPTASSVVPNISVLAREYLAALGIDDSLILGDLADVLWMHALAVGYAPHYLAENADGIRGDWPRIPLPDSKEALLASAELGRRVAALLDTENPVPEVTQGAVRPELRIIGTITREEGGAIDPAKGELTVTAGWGHAGQKGVTMPGKGKLVERAYTASELASMGESARLLGNTTLDVYLNDSAYWRNIPRRVWDYTIGGYQVIKKWLSYREHGLLGRSLTIEEAHYVEEMGRRIAALILLEPELDANYERVKSATYPWPGVEPEV